MTDLLPLFYVIVGLILRVAIPIGITFLMGWFLNRLDARWQVEAKQVHETLVQRKRPVSVQPCWEYMHCPASVRGNCPIFGKLDLLCWEFFGANGTVRPKCQACAYRRSALSIEKSLA